MGEGLGVADDFKIGGEGGGVGEEGGEGFAGVEDASAAVGNDGLALLFAGLGGELGEGLIAGLALDFEGNEVIGWMGVELLPEGGVAGGGGACEDGDGGGELAAVGGELLEGSVAEMDGGGGEQLEGLGGIEHSSIVAG